MATRPLTAGIHLNEILGLVAILVITGATAYGSMDLLLWDETMYLARGVDSAETASAGWEDSLSYSGLYWLLSTFVADPVDLYFVVRTLSSVLVVLGVYMAARMNCGPLPALSAAGVMAVLPVTYVWPGVGGPAAFALLVGAGLMWRWNEPWTLGIAAILTWVAAASRPEFTWVALLVSAWVVVWQVRDFRKQPGGLSLWKVGFSATGGLLVPLAVLLSFGNILASSPRQWTAFVQHFALRNGLPDQDVWVSADRIAQDFFPTSGSVTQALTENPGAVIEHAIANTLWLPVTLVGHILGFGGDPLRRPIPMFVALAFLGGVLLAAYQNRQVISGLVMARLRVGVPAIVYVALLLAAFAIPAVVIYPRPHYLLLPTMLLLFLAAVFMGGVPAKSGQRWIPGLTTLLGLSVAAVLSTQSLVDRLADPPAWETSIRALQKLPEGVRIVSVDERVCVYIQECVAVPQPDDSELSMSFAEYLDVNEINSVLTVPILMDSSWGQLRGAQEFLENPSDFDFEPVVPDGPIALR